MDARVAAALRAHPRDRFLPEAVRYRADHDGPIQIGHGQTCSQPRTVATMLELLQVLPGQRVLDVGAGSGWTTALLAHLVGDTGTVLGVEIVSELVDVGRANLAAERVVGARIERAQPGVLGAPSAGPFDRILVSADPRRLPRELVDQLGEGGRMVIPIDGWLTLLEQDAGEVRTSRHGPYRFVPLVRG
ncbi:protein-L-isoaspartate O-methyltransferase [Intrasporangium calvum]|uniref:Protein-L-isoaspartate O-methyltransferase n=1 Tax=Intrasporangium calvum TaxID=53358 RepID=A0ABT5GM30_9MICO|nr:protein-L-isoaspartate O-methyltransferase [Intrasporangium calvum]MDC5699297.1 protein-L-isoaspartate O-methyltransferase [Intrasporangium calvum]